jgi:hypothetical protein
MATCLRATPVPRSVPCITTDRWIRALEVRPSYPGGRQVVHHGNPRLLRLNEVTGEYERMGNLSEYAMGKIGLERSFPKTPADS